MKTVILSGGLGTRLGEETAIRPKPLVEIGGRPIIWHIMKIYSYYGINDFVILLGYKGYMIKEFFDNYRRHLFDIRLDFKKNKSEILRRSKIEEENGVNFSETCFLNSEIPSTLFKDEFAFSIIFSIDPLWSIARAAIIPSLFVNFFKFSNFPFEIFILSP